MVSGLGPTPAAWDFVQMLCWEPIAATATRSRCTQPAPSHIPRPTRAPNGCCSSRTSSTLTWRAASMVHGSLGLRCSECCFNKFPTIATVCRWPSAVDETSLQNFHTRAAARSKSLQEWRGEPEILFSRCRPGRHAKGLSAGFSRGQLRQARLNRLASAAMWLGPNPQQPPNAVTPWRCQPCERSTRSSGEMRSTKLHSGILK
jgi:hypothetical protein